LVSKANEIAETAAVVFKAGSIKCGVGFFYDISDTKSCHMSFMFDILKTHPDYFPDNIKMDSLMDLIHLYSDKVFDSLTLWRGGEIVGGIYLDNYIQDICTADINIFLKRHRVNPEYTSGLLLTAIRHFMLKHDLKLIGSIIEVDNDACLKLATAVRGEVTHIMKGYKTVGGVLKDCVYVSVLREGVLNG